MTISKILGLAFVAFFFVGCAHHRDVRPGANGVHKVTLQHEDTEDGARDAISQANHYCEQSGKHAAFIDESKKFTGDGSEADYKKGKTIAKVGQAVGSAAWIFGGKNESTAGGIVGLGSGIYGSALGKGYNVTMTFKCQ